MIMINSLDEFSSVVHCNRVYVNFWKHGINDYDVKKIVRFLKDSDWPAFLTIDLRLNKFSDDGVKTLTQLITNPKRKSHLTLILLQNKITSVGENLIIEALKNENCLPNLNIQLGESSSVVQDQIEKLLMKNNIRHTALSCIAVQQGNRQSSCFFSTLPQEILATMYEHAFPFQDVKRENEKKIFAKNISKAISNPSLFFKPKDAHHPSNDNQHNMEQEATLGKTHSIS